MELSAKKSNEDINMKDIVARNEEDDIKRDHEDAAKHKKESNLDDTETEVDKAFPDTGVEKNKRSIDENEEDDETE